MPEEKRIFYEFYFFGGGCYILERRESSEMLILVIVIFLLFRIYSLGSLSSALDVYYQQKLLASIMSHKVPCCTSGGNILFNKNTF